MIFQINKAITPFRIDMKYSRNIFYQRLKDGIESKPFVQNIGKVFRNFTSNIHNEIPVFASYHYHTLQLLITIQYMRTFISYILRILRLTKQYIYIHTHIHIFVYIYRVCHLSRITLFVERTSNIEND